MNTWHSKTLFCSWSVFELQEIFVMEEPLGEFILTGLYMTQLTHSENKVLLPNLEISIFQSISEWLVPDY